MSEIRISPTAQIAAVVTVLSLTAATIAAQLPEIRRYLKIKRM